MKMSPNCPRILHFSRNPVKSSQLFWQTLLFSTSNVPFCIQEHHKIITGFQRHIPKVKYSPFATHFNWKYIYRNHCSKSSFVLDKEMEYPNDLLMKNAATAQNILKNFEDEEHVRSSLEQSGISISLTEDLVLQVLRTHRSDWKPAYYFFNWVSSQKSYSQGSKACNEMIDILGKFRKFNLMMSLVQQMSKHKGSTLITERTYGILLNRYAAAHKIKEAVEIYQKREDLGLKMDTIAFQTLLLALCRYKHVEAAESLFHLKQNDCASDIKTRNIILNGWCVRNNIREAKRFWNDIISSGVKPDLFTYGIFINGLTKAGKCGKAVELFTAMWRKGCKPDVTICNCIIDALCFKKRIPEALTIFREMNEKSCQPDVATYNTLIKHICKIQRMEKAYELLNEMEKKGLTPNSITYIYFLKSVKKPYEVDELLNRMARNDCKLTDDSYNLLLRLFIGWKKSDRAQSLWIEMEKSGRGPDQRSYTIMIHGLYDQGQIDEALWYFDTMQSKGMIPEPRTVLLVKAIRLRKEKGDVVESSYSAKRLEQKEIR